MPFNNKNTALVKLNGTIVEHDGTERKSNFFKFLELNPDDYSDINYTPEEAVSIRSHLQHLSTGSAAVVPLICGGSAVCPFTFNCPFCRADTERKKKDPKAKSTIAVGRSCILEVELLNEWTRFYINEYEVDEESFTEFSMVRELAEIELMLYRLNNNLAKPENAELVQDTTVGIDKKGNVLTRKEINAFFEAKERLLARKSKLVKLMVGDRQEKYKREAALKVRVVEDPSSSAAQLRGKLNKLLDQAKGLDMKIKESEGNIIDTEEILSPEDLIGS